MLGEAFSRPFSGATSRHHLHHCKLGCLSSATSVLLGHHGAEDSRRPLERTFKSAATRRGRGIQARRGSFA